jgi:hypothetical protein
VAVRFEVGGRVRKYVGNLVEVDLQSFTDDQGDSRPVLSLDVRGLGYGRPVRMAIDFEFRSWEELCALSGPLLAHAQYWLAIEDTAGEDPDDELGERCAICARPFSDDPNADIAELDPETLEPPEDTEVATFALAHVACLGPETRERVAAYQAFRADSFEAE